MNKPYFIETIKVLDGKFCNLPYHVERAERTSFTFYKKSLTLSLDDSDIPLDMKDGLVKCRVIYADTLVNISYEKYVFRKIDSLAIIEDNSIDYTYKYQDRSEINSLVEKKGTSDDILIIQNGCLTDTSFCNIVLENSSGLFTPSTYLLNGTKRRTLINNGIIKEIEVKVEDIRSYSKLYLINAMIDLKDEISISTSNIF